MTFSYCKVKLGHNTFLNNKVQRIQLEFRSSHLTTLRQSNYSLLALDKWLRDALAATVKSKQTHEHCFRSLNYRCITLLHYIDVHFLTGCSSRTWCWCHISRRCGSFWLHRPTGWLLGCWVRGSLGTVGLPLEWESRDFRQDAPTRLIISLCWAIQNQSR